MTFLQLWLAIGAFDAAVNLIVWSLAAAQGRDVVALIAKKASLSYVLAFGVSISICLAGGPLSLAHTIFIFPRTVRTIWWRGWGRPYIIARELAACDHNEAEDTHWCPHCGAHINEDGTWERTCLGDAAVEYLSRGSDGEGKIDAEFEGEGESKAESKEGPQEEEKKTDY